MRAPLPSLGPLVPDEAALRALERRWRAARAHMLVVETESLRETVYVFRVPTGALWPDTAQQIAAAAREDVPYLVTAIRALRAEKALLLDLLRQGVSVAQHPEDTPTWTATVQAVLAQEASPDV
jgi:hypothetical protein